MFFDAFGLFFVSYAPALGWLILALGAAGYAIAAWRRARVAEVAKGAGVLLALIVVVGVGLYLVNLVSGAGGKTNYYDRLAAIPRLQVQALLVCLAVLVTMRRWLPSNVGTIAGAAMPLLALGAFAQADGADRGVSVRGAADARRAGARARSRRGARRRACRDDHRRDRSGSATCSASASSCCRRSGRACR